MVANENTVPMQSNDVAPIIVGFVAAFAAFAAAGALSATVFAAFGAGAVAAAILVVLFERDTYEWDSWEGISSPYRSTAEAIQANRDALARREALACDLAHAVSVEAVETEAAADWDALARAILSGAPVGLLAALEVHPLRRAGLGYGQLLQLAEMSSDLRGIAALTLVLLGASIIRPVSESADSQAATRRHGLAA